MILLQTENFILFGHEGLCLLPLQMHTHHILTAQQKKASYLLCLGYPQQLFSFLPLLFTLFSLFLHWACRCLISFLDTGTDIFGVCSTGLQGIRGNSQAAQALCCPGREEKRHSYTGFLMPSSLQCSLKTSCSSFFTLQAALLLPGTPERQENSSHKRLKAASLKTRRKHCGLKKRNSNL